MTRSGAPSSCSCSAAVRAIPRKLPVEDLDAHHAGRVSASSATRWCIRCPTRRRARFIARSAAYSSRLRAISSTPPACRAARSSPQVNSKPVDDLADFTAAVSALGRRRAARRCATSTIDDPNNSAAALDPHRSALVPRASSASATTSVGYWQCTDLPEVAAGTAAGARLGAVAAFR